RCRAPPPPAACSGRPWAPPHRPPRSRPPARRRRPRPVPPSPPAPAPSPSPPPRASPAPARGGRAPRRAGARLRASRGSRGSWRTGRARRAPRRPGARRAPRSSTTRRPRRPPSPPGPRGAPPVPIAWHLPPFAPPPERQVVELRLDADVDLAEAALDDAAAGGEAWVLHQLQVLHVRERGAQRGEGPTQEGHQGRRAAEHDAADGTRPGPAEPAET